MPEIPNPELNYLDLGNKEIKQHIPAFFIDLNKDGRKDVVFETQLVGDDIYKLDKVQFMAGSDIYTKLAVNNQEQILVMNKSAVIPLNDFNGNNWYEASHVVLVHKVIIVDIPIFWEGNWKGAVKKYLPVQLIKNNQRFNGWVELTVDIANEKITLHRAAISKLGEKEIKAG